MVTVSVLGFEGRLVYRSHAYHRMQQRRISEGELRAALGSAVKVEDYRELEPHPGMLVLGYAGKRPLHVVLAFDGESRTIYVITVYEPDSQRWENGFTRRRQ